MKVLALFLATLLAGEPLAAHGPGAARRRVAVYPAMAGATLAPLATAMPRFGGTSGRRAVVVAAMAILFLRPPQSSHALPSSKTNTPVHTAAAPSQNGHFMSPAPPVVRTILPQPPPAAARLRHWIKTNTEHPTLFFLSLTLGVTFAVAGLARFARHWPKLWTADRSTRETYLLGYSLWGQIGAVDLTAAALLLQTTLIDRPLLTAAAVLLALSSRWKMSPQRARTRLLFMISALFALTLSFRLLVKDYYPQRPAVPPEPVQIPIAAIDEGQTAAFQRPMRLVEKSVSGSSQERIILRWAVDLGPAEQLLAYDATGLVLNFQHRLRPVRFEATYRGALNFSGNRHSVHWQVTPNVLPHIALSNLDVRESEGRLEIVIPKSMLNEALYYASTKRVRNVIIDAFFILPSGQSADSIRAAFIGRDSVPTTRDTRRGSEADADPPNEFMAPKDRALPQPRPDDLFEALHPAAREYFEQHPLETHLVGEILSGDESRLKRAYSDYPETVRVLDGPSSSDGRSVYLFLETPLMIDGRALRVLRLKGVRPRKTGGTTVAPYVQGKGTVNYELGADVHGHIRRGPTPQSPFGVMTEDGARTEFEIMSDAATTNPGRFDAAVGWGLFPGLQFEGSPVGFVIAGMEHEDLRLTFKRTPSVFMPDTAARQHGVDSYFARQMDNVDDQPLEKGTVEDLLRQAGDALRRYHAAGRVHRYLRFENIGLRRDPSGQLEVVVRDLDTTRPLEARTREERAAHRLLDLQRMIRDLGMGNEDELLLAFLQGYFPHQSVAALNQMVHPLSGLAFARLFDGLVSGDVEALAFDSRHPIVGPLWNTLLDENGERSALRLPNDRLGSRWDTGPVEEPTDFVSMDRAPHDQLEDRLEHRGLIDIFRRFLSISYADASQAAGASGMAQGPQGGTVLWFSDRYLSPPTVAPPEGIKAIEYLHTVHEIVEYALGGAVDLALGYGWFPHLARESAAVTAQAVAYHGLRPEERRSLWQAAEALDRQRPEKTIARYQPVLEMFESLPPESLLTRDGMSRLVAFVAAYPGYQGLSHDVERALILSRRAVALVTGQVRRRVDRAQLAAHSATVDFSEIGSYQLRQAMRRLVTQGWKPMLNGSEAWTYRGVSIHLGEDGRWMIGLPIGLEEPLVFRYDSSQQVSIGRLAYQSWNGDPIRNIHWNPRAKMFTIVVHAEAVQNLRYAQVSQGDLPIRIYRDGPVLWAYNGGPVRWRILAKKEVDGVSPIRRDLRSYLNTEGRPFVGSHQMRPYWLDIRSLATGPWWIELSGPGRFRRSLGWGDGGFSYLDRMGRPVTLMGFPYDPLRRISVVGGRMFFELAGEVYDAMVARGYQDFHTVAWLIERAPETQMSPVRRRGFLAVEILPLFAIAAAMVHASANPHAGPLGWLISSVFMGRMFLHLRHRLNNPARPTLRAA